MYMNIYIYIMQYYIFTSMDQSYGTPNTIFYRNIEYGFKARMCFSVPRKEEYRLIRFSTFFYSNNLKILNIKEGNNI